MVSTRMANSRPKWLSQVACAAFSPSLPRSGRHGPRPRAPPGRPERRPLPWSIVARTLDELLGGQRSNERLDIDEKQRRGGGARCGDRTRQRVAAEMRRAQGGLCDVLRRRERDVLREREPLEALLEVEPVHTSYRVGRRRRPCAPRPRPPAATEPRTASRRPAAAARRPQRGASPWRPARRPVHSNRGRAARRPLRHASQNRRSWSERTTSSCALTLASVMRPRTTRPWWSV